MSASDQGQQAATESGQAQGQVQHQLSHRIAGRVAGQVDTLLDQRLRRAVDDRVRSQRAGVGAAPQGAQAGFGQDMLKILLDEAKNVVRSELPTLVDLVIQALQSEGKIAAGTNLS